MKGRVEGPLYDKSGKLVVDEHGIAQRDLKLGEVFHRIPIPPNVGNHEDMLRGVKLKCCEGGPGDHTPSCLEYGGAQRRAAAELRVVAGDHAARVEEIRAWAEGEWSPGDPHIRPDVESFTRDLLAAYDALKSDYDVAEAQICELVDRGLICDGNHSHGPCDDPECWHRTHEDGYSLEKLVLIAGREVERGDKATLQRAETVLDEAMGDTDGPGQASCPQHGPPEFRACRALADIMSGNRETECNCPRDDAVECLREWRTEAEGRLVGSAEDNFNGIDDIAIHDGRLTDEAAAVLFWAANGAN